MTDPQTLKDREWFTVEQLREEIHYDPETGIFKWLKRAKGRRMNKQPGCDNQDGYRLMGIFSDFYLGHRLAWLYMTEDWPKNQIDHIDGNPSNNKFSNLRDVTQSDNLRNMSLAKDNTSGRVGVCLDKRYSLWYARIFVSGKSISLGHFKDKNEAIRARKAAELKYGYHANHGAKR